MALKYFFIDFATSLVKWPLWWYSSGLVLIGGKLFGSVKSLAKTVALGVWMRNIFTPMFGQNDWQSRIISFFMRIFQIIFKLIKLFFWSILMIGLYILYLVLPIFAVFGLAFQVFGSLVV